VLWNNVDGDMLTRLSRKLGVASDELQHILEQECQGSHDSLWLDFTPDSPAPIRKNGYERLSL